MTTILISSFFWATVCVYHEAQGEPIEGQIAVAQVIMNRAIKRRQSVQEVITADKQFSWYDGHEEPPIQYYTEFMSAMKAVGMAMLQRLGGNTLHGANLYYNPEEADPYWSHLKRVKLIANIGNHRFMRE